MITVRYLNARELDQTFTFSEFLELCENLAANQATTGNEQSEKHIHFTKLNVHRLRRINKTLKLELDTLIAFQNFNRKIIWLVIVESWCGDVAQNLPYIHAMSELNENIQLKLILKSDYPEIMRKFLTNGTESIPKLICISEKDCEVMGTWGARPAETRKLVEEFRNNPHITKPEFLENIQKWYNQDKGRSIQQEFRSLLQQWDKKWTLMKEPI
jgi:hypothetical protein